MSERSERKKKAQGSNITLTLNLPRVIERERGTVAHILVDPSNILDLVFDSSHSYVDMVACHAPNVEERYLGNTTVWGGATYQQANVEFAVDGDPTCKACLRRLKFLTA